MLALNFICRIINNSYKFASDLKLIFTILWCYYKILTVINIFFKSDFKVKNIN